MRYYLRAAVVAVDTAVAVALLLVVVLFECAGDRIVRCIEWAYDRTKEGKE